MSIIITGGNGQLGTELRHLLDERGLSYHAADVQEMDITDKRAVDHYFKTYQPTIVFHCAAYTAVDKAEDEGKELDEKINVLGTENVARAAEQYGAVMFYVSTDYVFDGKKKNEEYQVDDATNPLNEYGRTKLEGEKLVQDICSKYYIIRTSWVFGNYGHNFVFTMQRLAKEHETLTVVNDQFGRPTWTRTLAEFLVFLMEEKPAYGIYHLSNDGFCSWYEFAKEILKEADVNVLPVDSSAYPQKAIRPQYAVMSLEKTKALGFKIPTWQEALEQMIDNIED